MTPSLPKKDKGNAPLDHRLLAIFTALYRIEAGAWFDQIGGWLQEVLHPVVIGAIPGREDAAIAWDAQAYLEHAMMNNLGGAISTYDFRKYFDSFDYNFTMKMFHSIFVGQASSHLPQSFLISSYLTWLCFIFSPCILCRSVLFGSILSYLTWSDLSNVILSRLCFFVASNPSPRDVIWHMLTIVELKTTHRT